MVSRMSYKSFSIILIMIVILIRGIQLSLASDASDCIERGDELIPYDMLPESMRIMIHNTEQDLLKIVNVETGTSDILIDNFDDTVNRFTLLDDGQTLLMQHNKRWQIIDIETFASNSITQNEADEILMQQTQMGAILAVPYIDDEYFDYTVDNFTKQNFPPPDLKNPVIYEDYRRVDPIFFATIKYASNRKYVAYRAYVNGFKQQKNIVLRVENVETHDYVDIDVSEWENGFSFYWNTSSEQIYIQDQTHFSAYDPDTGEMILKSEPIPYKTDEKFDPVSILQSHNNSRLLVSYYTPDILDHSVKLYFYDLTDREQLPYCLDLEFSGLSATGMLAGEYVWSLDNRYIWWLEKQAQFLSSHVDIVIFDTATQLYGVIAENVGKSSRIGFVEN